MSESKISMTLRITKNMADAIKERSRKIGVSKNAFILYALDKALKDEERTEGKNRHIMTAEVRERKV